MKRLLLVIAILLFAGQAWAVSTTYYVNASAADDTGNGITAATPCKAIATCITKANAVDPDGDPTVAAGQGHTIKIAPGNYTGRGLVTDTDMAGATLVGCTDATFAVCTSAARDLVIWQGPNTNAQDTLYISANAPNVRLRNMTLWQRSTSATCAYIEATGFDAQDVHFIAKDTASNRSLVSLAGGDGAIFKYNLFEGMNGGSGITTTGDGGGTVSYNIFRGNRALASPYWKISGGINHGGSTALNAYNNILSDALSNDVIMYSGTGGGTAKNNIIYAPVNVTNAYGIDRSNGTVTENYNIIVGNPRYAGLELNGTINGGAAVQGANTLYNTNPMFISPGKKGYVIIQIDSHMSAGDASKDYLNSLASMMSPYGFTGTVYIWPAGQSYHTDHYGDIRTLVSGGILEIGAGLWSGNAVALTTSGTLACSAGCTAPKYKVTAGTPYTISLDYNNDGVADCTSTIMDVGGATHIGATSELITCAAGLGATVTWTLTPNASEYLKTNTLTAVGVWTALGALAIDQGVDSDCTGGNCDRYYKEEIYNVKSYMEDTLVNAGGDVTDPQTGSTYALRSFAYRGTTNVAAWQSAIETSGYVNNTAASATYQDLSSFDLHNIPFISNATYLKASEALTKAFFRNICAQAAEHGLVLGIQTSYSDGTPDVPLTGGNDWAAILSVLNECSAAGQIEVVSAQQFTDIVKAAPWTDNGDGTVSRAYGATAVDDNHLQSGSPAINTGTFVAGVHDVAGATSYNGIPLNLKRTPNIGAYETGKPTLYNASKRAGKFY